MKQHWIRWCAVLCAALFLSVEAAAAPKMLIPGGCTIGMKLDTQGVLVTGFAEESSAERAGLKKGDVIIEVDGEAVHTVAALQESLEESQVVLTVLRNGKEAEFCVNPQKTEDGSRLGAYVRDSVAGIGTVTYYDPNTGNFGALGHGVNDAETSILMPLEAGVVVRSTVSQVEKGKVGKPGELRGVFHVDDILGEVSANTEQGVFGRLTTPVAGTPVPVASPEEVHPGEAEIRCNVSDHEVATYCVEIEKVFSNTSHTGRNLMLKITDPALLAATGGIVQGMSGSPILQDGKLVGAVTHVLVNEPTKGYGIFIENMLDAAGA